ncbi:MAG: hypothetical protein ABIP93_12000 [Gemmatimonadaceae bacterium]
MPLSACRGDGGHVDALARIAAPEEASDIDEAEVPGAVSLAPTLLRVQTYEGSGQLVHPDVAFFSRGWQGQRYWLAATPYPNGNPRVENPSIFSGASPREMLVPPGMTNPLALPVASGYLSDPDLVHDPATGELRMYYRQTVPEGDELYLTTSRNGVDWSKGRRVLSDSRYALISPAVVRETGGAWRMWLVNAVENGCKSTRQQLMLQQRRSTDGVTWGTPERVELTINGRVPWHWDVQYVAARSEYWALVAAYPEGANCAQTSIYFARSANGTDWQTSPVPLLATGTFAPISDLVYRSTFHYHEKSEVVSVWYSGARVRDDVFQYAVVSARYSIADLLLRVSGSPGATVGRAESQRTSRSLIAAREQFIAEFP